MRQRASTKTQRRLKQQQLGDPYKLTDDVYAAQQQQTFRVGGLVTAAGVLQLAVAVTLGGYVFGGALLFCFLLMAALGVVAFTQLEKQPMRRGLVGHVAHSLQRLHALRRGALDYSLTLSIADSQSFADNASHGAERLQIAVVPTHPTPQKVVAAMALASVAPRGAIQQKATTTSKKSKQQKTKSMAQPLARQAPIATLKQVVMTETLPFLMPLEKPRAQSEPKLPVVLRRRPQPDVKLPTVLLPTAEPKLTVPSKPQPKLPTVLPPVEPKRLAMPCKPEPKLPTVLPKSEPKQALPKPVQQQAWALPEAVKEPCVQVTASAPTAVQPMLPPLPVLYSAPTPLVKLARGEPAVERDLVVTRKVSLYLQPQEQELESEEVAELTELAEVFPPLPPTSEFPPVTAEHNFLLDIALEPTSTPEEATAPCALPLAEVCNPDLRVMLEELSQMRLELDAAMALCTATLQGEGEKLPASWSPPLPPLEPEVEPCC
ncbi:hypothetical protein BBJ28_00013265 [Nothophytophthora sp. Chile5]|nr:hypothetical protein BBJ28_00013265 [Nothophytophthora sp. Chile5]